MGTGRGWLVSMWVAVVALLLVAVPSILAPDWAVGQFPWKVGPFLAQTIGCWCLGIAGSATIVALAPADRPDRVVALLWTLGLFAAFELIVVLAFLDRLQAAHLLAWPYLVGLGALLLGVLLRGIDLVRHRPDLRGPAGPVPTWVRVTELLFVGFVLVLALGNLLSSAEGPVSQGRFFPEPLGLFSIRAFAAFFGSLALGTVALLPARNLRPVYEFTKGGLLLVTPITLVTLLNLGRFDLLGVPGGLLYLVAYVGVTAAAILFIVWSHRTPAMFPGGEAPGRGGR